MMNKTKSFKEGDKVFAKVKGYPAWPAKVTKKIDKKFEVLFYGTKETGTIKLEDLCLYVENKSTVLKKPINRKFYSEAVQEIEDDLRSEGVNVDELNGSLSETKTPLKRKRSESHDSTPTEANQTKLKSENGNSVKMETEAAESKIETPKTEKKKRGPKPKKSINTLDKFLIKSPPPVVQKETSNQDSGMELIEDAPEDLDIISADYLRHLVDYAGKVRSKEEHYKSKQLENYLETKNQALVAKLPSGSFIGIKYQLNSEEKIGNEFDLAEQEEKAAKKVLELLEKVQEGSLKPEDEPSLFYMNIRKSEAEIREATLSKIVQRKDEMLKWLEVESNVVNLDTKLRMALSMQKADSQSALEHLRAIDQIKIDPLMLKKHPQVAETVKRLRKYVGNVSEWNLSEEEEKQFQIDAEEIRKLAKALYDKFKGLFKIAEGELFWDFFTKRVEEFKENSKEFSEVEVYGLCAEPDSRQAYLDLQLGEINVEKQKDNQEKENISQVANGTVHTEDGSVTNSNET